MMILLNFYNNALSLEEMIELRRTNPVPDENIIHQMVVLSEVGSQAIETIEEHLEKNTADEESQSEASEDEEKGDEAEAEREQESIREE